MKKRLVFFVSIILVLTLFVSGCINSTTTPAPGSFGISVYADLTSSGGSRYYNATLAFSGDELMDGWSKWVSDGGDGRHTEYECVANLSSLKWMDAKTNQTCNESLGIISGTEDGFLPLTKKGIQKLIDDGTIKPTEKCMHLDICYDMLHIL